MSIRSTNTTRNIEARKSSLPTIGRGVPHNSQGNEGDLTFRRTSDGLMLYIKANHSWHGVKVGESFSSLESTIKDIKSKVDLMKQFRLPSTYSVKGDFTLDVSGDIEFNADGGQVNIMDGGDIAFVFDCDGPRFRIYDDANSADHFTIDVGADGATTLTTVDSDGTSGDLSLSPDGKIKLYVEDGGADEIQCVVGSNKFASFAAEDGSYSRLTMYEQGGSSSNDYMKLDVAEHGATTLTAHDTAAEAAHITLDADGNIVLDAVCDATDTGIIFNNAGTGFAKINVHHSASYITLLENGGAGSDQLNIQVLANGATDIGTTDFAGSAAHITLDADGDITLDSNTGNFIAKKGGTEFSATNSAYAGMILGYTHLTSTSTTESIDLTTSLAVIDADAKITFTAPPSGNVEIEFSVYRDSSSSNRVVTFSLSDNSTFNQASAQIGDGSSTYDLIYLYGFDTADETDDRYLTGKFVVGGLTAGSSYTYWLGARTSATTTRLRWGGITSTTPDRYYPPFVIKATALPASIHTQ